MQRRTLIACLVSFAVSAATFAQTAAAQSSRVFNHPSGFSFLAPEGWRVEASGNATVVVPPGSVANDASERIRVLAQPFAHAADDPRFGAELDQVLAQLPGYRKVGASQPYQTVRGSPGLASLWTATAEGVGHGVQMRVYAATVNGVAAGILAAGTAERLDLRNAQLQEMALSVGPALTPPKVEAPGLARPPVQAVGDPLAQFWMQRMTGKLLTQLSSYNSGGGSGGMSSKIVIHLQTDGSFQAQSSSSLTINVPGANASSGGANHATGTWRIYAHAGQAILEIRYANGQIESNLLQANGEQTHINGKRWFVTDPQ